MSSLWQQLHALRTPSEFRISQGEDLHHHIVANIIPFLERIPRNLLLEGDGKSISDPLEILNASEDTLPYLYTLTAQIDAAIQNWKERGLPKTLEPGGQLWQNLATFLTTFDPLEIRYAGQRWTYLMDLFDRLSWHVKVAPIMGLMAHAMLRLDPSAGTFTTTHLHFVRLCLRSHSLRDARMILDRDIHSLPPQRDFTDGFPCSPHHLSNGYITQRSCLTDKYTLADILEYYMDGAMIYIALHEWERASFFLEYVLSTPTNNTANGMMLEAYKKWVLVGLLANGKRFATPKPVNTQAMKSIRSLSKAYDSVAEAFISSKTAKLSAEIHDAVSIWQEDANEGLMRHVLEHHRKLSVIRLGEIYAAVPISQISRTLGSSTEDAEAYVSLLIHQGLLKASLGPAKDDGAESIVTFFDNSGTAPLAKSEEQLRFELIEQVTQIKTLDDHIKEVDRRLSLSKEYLDHVRKARNADRERNSPEHDMDISPEPFAPGPGSDDEENVMADVG